MSNDLKLVDDGSREARRLYVNKNVSRFYHLVDEHMELYLALSRYDMHLSYIHSVDHYRTNAAQALGLTLDALAALIDDINHVGLPRLFPY